MNCLTLFAGCGGADLGLQRAGIEHLACVEGDPSALATLQAAGFPGVWGWIGEKPPAPTPKPGRRARAEPPVFDPSPYVERVDLLWASPPCQPYSRAGKGEGASDPRDGWPATLATIKKIRPTWAIIENVVGSPSGLWVSQLQEAGYAADFHKIDAVDFGLPSHRRRVFIVAGPKGIGFAKPEEPTDDPRVFRWPTPTHYGPDVPFFCRGGRQPWVSFGAALGLLGAVTSTHPDEAGFGSAVAERREILIDGPSRCISATYSGSRGGDPYVLIPGNGGNLPAPRNQDQPAHSVTASCPQYLSPLLNGPALTVVGTDGVGLGSRKSRDWLQRATAALSAPSAGVTCQEIKGTRASKASNYEFNGGPDRGSGSLHLATGRRRLTIDECRILVGLPEGYPFSGTSEARYRQIGNVVAPIVAEVLGRALSCLGEVQHV